MQGLMQDWPLRVTRILEHAARYHADRTVIGRSVEGPIVSSTWAQVHLRARKLAQALTRLGVRRGDMVGAMAWNTVRHVEVWYGVPGSAGVLHSLNPRLSSEQLIYIINHAEDGWIFVDPDLVGVLEGLAGELTTAKGYIVMTDRANMPETSLSPVLCYEELIEAEDGGADWVPGDESDACGVCFTSGTTGHPKGVVYSHRSNVLHAMVMVQQDMLGLSSNDTLMPVVPLFHANGWSTGFATPLTGSAMVLPGRQLDAASLYEMLGHGVTITAAVPTVWLPLLKHLKEDNLDLPTLRRVVIGGSSCPRAVIETFQNDYGVQVLHAWGMTETSPLGTICSFKPEIAALSDSDRLDTQEKVGHCPFTVDLVVRDDDDNPQPWDGESQGRLLIRGPGVVKRYLKQETDAVDGDSWFDTGDAATMDANGYVRITDRFKDVIKSGGEWISSIDMENIAVGHPGVFEAAAVGVPHPKWDERPILLVVKQPGADPQPDEIVDLLRPHFAKWQLPDDVLFVDEIPHTATGKISKLSIRKLLDDQEYQLPDQR
ncbi:MAG: long-chain-fatty-acid--CoA ligase [Pseudomonadota bacterium]